MEPPQTFNGADLKVIKLLFWDELERTRFLLMKKKKLTTSSFVKILADMLEIS